MLNWTIKFVQLLALAGKKVILRIRTPKAVYVGSIFSAYLINNYLLPREPSKTYYSYRFFKNPPITETIYEQTYPKK